MINTYNGGSKSNWKINLNCNIEGGKKSHLDCFCKLLSLILFPLFLYSKLLPDIKVWISSDKHRSSSCCMRHGESTQCAFLFSSSWAPCCPVAALHSEAVSLWIKHFISENMFRWNYLSAKVNQSADWSKNALTLNFQSFIQSQIDDTQGHRDFLVPRWHTITSPLGLWLLVGSNIWKHTFHVSSSSVVLGDML